MLNKLQFNNLVISNKKGIQQARIQTINKLVHKIRKLKTLLEKHPDNTKCKERVRKSTETIEFLKKIKRVDIMKQALLMDKAPAAIITNGLATPDEVGVALLAMNKVMVVLIKRFKTELKLDDKESVNWKEELNELSKRRQKIERTEEKRRKRVETKEQKAVGRKRQEWIQKNNPGAEEEQETIAPDTDLSIAGNWKVDEMEIDEKEETIKKTEKIKVHDLKRLKKEKPAIKKTDIVNKKPKEKVSKTKLIENENQFQNDDTEEVIVSKKNNKEISAGLTFTEENIESQDFSDDNHVEKYTPEDCDEEPEETMVVDPFFITDTGENYLSTAVIKRGQNAGTENDEDKRGLHMIKLNSTKNPNETRRDRRQQSRDANQSNYRDRNQKHNKWNNEGNGEQKYQQNNWNKQNERNEKFQQNNWKNNKDKEFNNKRGNSNVSTNKEEQNLHPSWAAKQKLKPVITSFQGKKITFGDDDNSNKTSNTYNQPQKPVTRNPTPKPTNSDKDSLHPSWIAKQKLKPTITAFQGKKITFDN